jgi:hypothetical protein
MFSPELVAMVVSSLATHLTLAGASFAQELGKTAAAKVGDLYKTVKERFAKEKKDKNINQTLKEFEKKPEEWIGPMKSALMTIMSKDPEFTAILEKLIKESKEESKKAGTENNFKTMVTGGYVGKIINIGTIEGNADF